MGLYDIVGARLGIQIKSTPDPEMRIYSTGDKIDLPDGVHIGYEGWFVVSHGKIKCMGEMVYDKYGCELIKEELMNARNPIARVVDSFRNSITEERIDNDST